MSRFILHIGPHKTGTTAIQQALVRLRPALAALGVCYPTTWQDWLWGHHALPRLLAGARGDAGGHLALQAQVAELAAQAPCILLSTEDLSPVPPASIAVLAAALAGHEVEVVFALRRGPEMLASTWQESVKQGGVRTLPEFVLTEMSFPLHSGVLGFDPVLRRWAQAFGHASLRLVSYDGVLAKGDTLLRVLLEDIIGVSIPGAAAETGINTSADPVDVEAIRLLNLRALLRSGAAAGPVGPGPREAYMALDRARDPRVAALRDALAPLATQITLAGDHPAFRAIEARILKLYPDRLMHNPPAALFPPAPPLALRHHLPDAAMRPAVAAALEALDAAVLAAG
jgi:hypothetical protein